MFLGEHSHSLDAKGRVILPARFRDQLESAFVTSEVDGCLALWPPEEFEGRSQEMKAKWRGTPADRNQARVFFAGAQDASPDKQGRVAIPPALRAFAHLEREVAVTGAWDHVEIWDAATWQETKRQGEQGLAGDGAESADSPPIQPSSETSS
ncbi:MAG: transcriptional regulator MraZ [Acidimicrobiaceae bacterium]|jgi:MraZ protein